MRDLYDFAPLGYLRLRGDTVILQANLREGAAGRRAQCSDRQTLRAFPCAQVAGCLSPLLARLHPDRPPQACDLLLRKSDGATVPVSVETAEQKGAQPNAWRCAISDITERRHAEA